MTKQLHRIKGAHISGKTVVSIDPAFFFFFPSFTQLRTRVMNRFPWRKNAVLFCLLSLLLV